MATQSTASRCFTTRRAQARQTSMRLCAIVLFLSVTAWPSARAEMVLLGTLLERFRHGGVEIVYSTDVVDEHLEVDWQPGRLTAGRLDRILRPLGLGLERVGKRKWIVRTRADDKADHSIVPSSMPDYLEHIVVTASVHDIEGREQPSRYRISDVQMEQTPSLAGDSMRVIHRLPGAASIGVSSKPNVRGGDADELLVVFDGVELIEPFHLRDFQAILSTINPQTVRNIEFFTGGFPARYGNKISGVLDISSKDTFASSRGGELGISAYSTSGLYYRETSDSQWLVSARRGNLDLVLDRVNPRLGRPRYHDLYGSFTRNMRGGGRFKIGALAFYDDIHLATDEVLADSRVDNRYLWMQWSKDLDARLYVSTLLSATNLEGRRGGKTFAEDSTEGGLLDNQDLIVRSATQTVEWKTGDLLKLTGGFTIADVTMRYRTLVGVEKGIVAELLGLPTTVHHDISRKVDGTRTGVHFSAKARLADNLTIQSGFRLDWQSYLDVDTEFQFSPRMALLYSPIDDLSIRLSYGRFQQPPGPQEMETADGDTTFADIQQADHFIVGAEYRWGNAGRLEVEMFYKSMDEVKHRYENLFNPYVLLPELEPDRIAIRPREAYAEGIEIGYYGGRGNFTWTVNYAYSKAQDLGSDRWIFRRWDQTHNVNAILNWQYKRWRLSVAGAWHTGWTMTSLPDELPAEPLPIAEYRSNARLKDYGTLDFRLAYEHPLPASSLTGFIEVTNLISRSNKGGVDYEISREGNVYLLEEVDLEPVFPLVASVGLVWRF